MPLKNYTDSIPGGFTYIHPVTSAVIGPEWAFRDLVTRVHEHEQANSLSPTLPDVIEAQVCTRFPTSCYPGDVPHPSSGQGAPVFSPSPTGGSLTFWDVVKATGRMGKWLLLGSPKVTSVLSAERALACLSCPQHTDVPGCARCVASRLRNTIVAVIGLGNFAGSSQLKVCRVCGCALEAKVQIPVEFFAAERERVPSNCWIVKETHDI